MLKHGAIVVCTGKKCVKREASVSASVDSEMQKMANAGTVRKL